MSAFSGYFGFRLEDRRCPHRAVPQNIFFSKKQAQISSKPNRSSQTSVTIEAKANRSQSRDGPSDDLPIAKLKPDSLFSLAGSFTDKVSIQVELQRLLDKAKALPTEVFLIRPKRKLGTLTLHPQSGKHVEIDGRAYTVQEWSKRYTWSQGAYKLKG
eukprot:CAMPEP_0196665004 /NCGR_PEP_ID=MMETSP1086-20130531/59293_1 /TAXON_ID=77921 /ORGANISM="Cyanoptyche  gloeocystis , Strain SAG4.97" /LENGTH=156 /DNA_ID=CAMNT_0042001557 /DNA_START=51 /DNA_END=517 /DNA_ORIENTATION=+